MHDAIVILGWTFLVCVCMCTGACRYTYTYIHSYKDGSFLRACRYTYIYIHIHTFIQRRVLPTRMLAATTHTYTHALNNTYIHTHTRRHGRVLPVCMQPRLRRRRRPMLQYRRMFEQSAYMRCTRILSGHIWVLLLLLYKC